MSNDRKPVIARIQKTYRECLKFSSEHPDIAVNRCRKILEMMLGQLISEKNIEVSDKARSSVDSMISICLKSQAFTRLQQMNMKVVQEFGNFGSHFKEQLKMS